MFFKTNTYSEEKTYLIMATTNYIEKEKYVGFIFLFFPLTEVLKTNNSQAENNFMGLIPTFSSHSLKPLFPRVPWPYNSLTPNHPAYQPSLSSVINLSVKISLFLPVVSSTASLFAENLQKLPLSCRVSRRLIKLSWSVTRHPEREGRGGGGGG